MAFDTMRPQTSAFDIRQSLDATIQDILKLCETQSVLSQDDMAIGKCGLVKSAVHLIFGLNTTLPINKHFES